MQKSLILAAVAALAAGVAPAVQTSVAPVKDDTESKPLTPPVLIWYDSLETALTFAKAEYKPLFVLFTSPDCGWCKRLKAETLGDPEIVALLKNFSLVEVDVTRNEKAAREYQVRGVPTILILSGDGLVRGGVSGYVSGERLKEMVKDAVNPAFLRKSDVTLNQLLMMIETNGVPADKWPEIMLSLGMKERRAALHEKVFTLSPFPKPEVVGLLKDPRLAVRLGTLEVLEELAGDTFGFDPWGDAAAPSDRNRRALAKWEAWSGQATGAVTSVYSALTRDQVEGCIQDLLSDNRERSGRALRTLENGGAEVAQILAEFIERHPDIPAASRTRLKEVQYALYLPPVAGLTPSELAHRLVSGTLDVRLKAISSLQMIGTRALPVLKEFLKDRDPIVRETTVDAMAGTHSGRVVPLIAEHLKQEKDKDVVHAAIRGLGQIRSKRGLAVLTETLSHPDEDMVITALNSIGRLKSSSAGADVAARLEDPRWRVRVAALDAVAKLKLKNSEDPIVKMLDDKDEFVRYSAVKTLAELSAKKSAKKLEEVFLKEDALKGPVIEAFGSIDVPLPPSFEKELKGKNPDVLLSIIEALKSSGDKGARMAAGFLGHENPDVACAAIRLLALHGMKRPESRRQIIEVLKSGPEAKVLAALESITIDRDIRQSLSWSSGTATSVPGETGTVSKAGAEAIDSLFAAFEGAGGEGAKPAVATQKTEAVPAANVEDIFGAFLSAPVTASPSGQVVTAVSARDSVADLMAAVEGCLQPPHSDSVNLAAALLLLEQGNPKAIPFIAKGLSTRTASQRQEIATKAGRMPSADILPVLRLLLQDPSPEVRAETVEACLNSANSAAALEVLFEEFMRPSTRLASHEMYHSGLERAAQRSAGKTAIRKWAQKILAERKDEAAQNLGLVLLETAWRKGDEETVRKFCASEQPLQRRAAWHALGKDLTAFGQDIAKAATDPSDFVRIVVPHVYMLDHTRWIHYFDSTHFAQDQSWRSSYSSRVPGLPDEAREAVQKLTRDDSPKVRIEAFFCLLSRREPVDLGRFVETLDSFPDRESVGSRVTSYLSSNYEKLGKSFRVLLPYMEATKWEGEYLEKMRKHFGMEDEEETEALSWVSRTNAPAAIPATYLAVPEAPAATNLQQNLRLVYFTSPGCQDCARVERFLPELKEYFPALTMETHNIRKVAAMRLNEALCERFGVPENVRLVAPALFCGGGFAIKKDITVARVGELLGRSAAVPLEKWHTVSADDLGKADQSIGSRYSAMSVGLVMLAGLLDGINPCAFATIIFLLSYLQIARRTPRETAQVGLAFVAGVFLAYFLLGLGLMEALSQSKILVRFGQAVKWTLAAFTLLIMVLSIRDGVLCLQGRLKDITLQLPGFLKEGIHAAIRTGARHRRYVIAAFGVGVVISFLELACTGQVYGPTIVFMLQTGQRLDALLYLLVYNLVFILPLCIVFALAFFGMKSDALLRFMEKHAALVKFATAGLFLLLFLVFVFADKITALMRSPGLTAGPGLF